MSFFSLFFVVSIAFTLLQKRRALTNNFLFFFHPSKFSAPKILTGLIFCFFYEILFNFFKIYNIIYGRVCKFFPFQN